MESTVLSTGIRTLDVVLDGGIPNRSLVLVVGDVGYIHTLLVQNLAFHFTKQADTKIVYVTYDSAAEELTKTFTEIGMNISAIPEERWEFIDMFREEPLPGIFDMNPMSILMSEYLDKYFSVGLTAAEIVEREDKPLITVIDSLSTVLNQIPEWGIDIDDFYTMFIKEFVHSIKKRDGIHFWLMTRGLQEERVLTMIAHLSDVVFSCRQKQTGERVSNFIQIPKLGKHILKETRAREYPIMVGDNYQVRIDTKERIV